MANYAYPENVSKIPYASFLRITRYEYNSGLANAKNAANLGTQGRIKNLNGALGGFIGGTTTALFGQNASGNLLSPASRVTNLTNAQRRALGITTGGSSGGQRSAAGAENEAQAQLQNISKEEWNKIAQQGGVEVTNPNGTKSRITSYEQIQSVIEGKSGTEQESNTSKLDIVLPNEVAFSYGAEWNNTFKLGTLALLAGNTAQGTLQTLATAGIGAGLGAVNAFANQGTGTTQTPRQQIGAAALSGAAAGINPFGINSPLGIQGAGLTNIVGLAGLAPNENAIQFFQRMANREFSFTFEMFAPNSTIADHIEEIVNIFFKQGMHPDDKVGLLGFPDVYEIEPRFVTSEGRDDKHRLLPKTKLCAITNLKVNASPASFFQTTYDGYVPIITCEVTFKELTALSRQDLSAGL